VGLTVFAVFLLSIVVFAVLLFGTLRFRLDFGFKVTSDLLGISVLVIFLWLCIRTLITTTVYKRKLTRLLEGIDIDNLSQIGELANQN